LCIRIGFVPAGQGYPAMAGVGWLPLDKPDGSLPRPWASENALDALRSLVKEFSSARQPLWCPASLRSGASGTAHIFHVRTRPSMHVVGASPLAAELRRLLTDGAEPGWELHPVAGGPTPLHVLAAPLRRLSGNGRFYNLLDRSGFAYVEEVAATPEECLADLRNGGPRFVAAVRQAISEVTAGAATPAADAAPDDREPGTRPLPALAPATLRALQVTAAWAVAEQGARSAGDLFAAVGRTRELPPEVASAWNHVRQLDLRQLAGPLLPVTGLAGLAAELLAEVDQRRRMILTARTFAPPPRLSHDVLAVKLDITPKLVRQLEADALAKLTKAAADDRYAPLRRRAASPAQPGIGMRRRAEDAPAWMDGLLRWLGGHAG
jgi:hypothetical protein